MLGNAAHSTGLALIAVALVLALHAFVLFKGQQDSFLYVIPNAALGDLRLTIILAAVFLGWSVLYTIYCQTMHTDIAMIDWERPQQVWEALSGNSMQLHGISAAYCLPLSVQTKEIMLWLPGVSLSDHWHIQPQGLGASIKRCSWKELP